MNERVLRAVGLLLLILGLGLLMDSPWRAAGCLLVVLGGIPAAVGLWMLAVTRGAFVPRRSRR